MRAILSYHSVDQTGSVISLTRAQFGEHVRWLSSSAVRVVSIPELLADEEPGPAVALTFDDGFSNFATAAWPLLQDHGMLATLFVPTGFVGSSNDWASLPGGRMPTLELLDWSDLGRLAEEGVALGAHSRTHPDLRSLADGRLEDEVAGSIEDILRETGFRAEGFAYPYGFLNERVVAAVRQTCSWACTTLLRPLRDDDTPYRLPRIDSYYLRGPARLANYGNASFRSYLALRSGLHRLRAR